MASSFNLQKTNSTTYADIVGVQLGVGRLPGETADTYLDRLYHVAYNRRDHSLEGTIDEIAFHLGLQVRPGLMIVPSDPTTIITTAAGQMVIQEGTQKTTIVMVSIDPDNFWNWRMLSSVAADVNALTHCTATLLIPDVPSSQLVRQTSLNYSVAENVSSISNQLKHSGIQIGSEQFNVAVPSYTLRADGSLVFASAPPANTLISYIYNLSPFPLVCSEVATFSLMDPALKASAKCPDGSLVHQIREYVQAILIQDPSYWGT